MADVGTQNCPIAQVFVALRNTYTHKHLGLSQDNNLYVYKGGYNRTEYGQKGVYLEAV